MKGNSNVKNILVDLDSLLDTRLGILRYYVPSLIDKVVIPSFANRLVDDFPVLNHMIFKHLYSNRGNNILPLSPHTRMYEHLKHEIKYMRMQMQKDNSTGIIELDVNIYPYNMTDDVKHTLAKGIATMIDLDYVSVNIIRKHPIKEIPIVDILSRYECVIMYKGYDYLIAKLANRELVENNIPQVRFYTPTILDKPIKLDKPEDYDKVFETVMLQYEYFVNLRPLETRYFSVFYV